LAICHVAVSQGKIQRRAFLTPFAFRRQIAKRKIEQQLFGRGWEIEKMNWAGTHAGRNGWASMKRRIKRGSEAGGEGLQKC
jgi:hypothetical protein